MAARQQKSKPHAVVVGASGAIGSRVAKLLRPQFATIGVDRKRAPAAWCGPFLRVSLRNAAAIDEAVSFLNTFEGRVAVAVFANGSYRRTPLDMYSVSALDDCLWDNYLCTFWLARYLVAQMRRRGGGRIVFVTSQASVLGGGDPVYAGAKAAVQALMKSIAREYGGQGIRSNAISPGPVATPMANVMTARRQRFYRKAIPIGRFCTAAEVARAVAFVASGTVDALNGQTLDVDGGLVRR
jgi:3-oxoacyl-[acyl-carrier protein] reductase